MTLLTISLIALMMVFPILPVDAKMPSGIAEGHSYNPPREQLREGHNPTDILCYDGRILKFKISNNAPVCLYPTSIDKLLDRGYIQN